MFQRRESSLLVVLYGTVTLGCHSTPLLATKAPPTSDASTFAARESDPAQARAVPEDAGSACGVFATAAAPTIGAGDVDRPARGPAPALAARLAAPCFVLVKNWDFGREDTIRDVADLIAEFQFHDQFNTIANGDKYGAVIVAPTAATAIFANGLGLPGGRQPVEDPQRPYREWTAHTLRAHVRPLSPTQATASASAHDAGCGSIVAKWHLPRGGALLGKDLLWETRVRMPAPRPAYWFALWTAGNKWSRGAEMDVVESFGSPNVYPPANLFHVASAGGVDHIHYGSWPDGLAKARVAAHQRDLSEWHTWSWLYRRDDTYTVFFDDHVVQTGAVHWTRQGAAQGEPIDMTFLFDFSWGHTKIKSIDITLPASEFPLTYEIDYSRVYLR